MEAQALLLFPQAETYCTSYVDGYAAGVEPRAVRALVTIDHTSRKPDYPTLLNLLLVRYLGRGWGDHSPSPGSDPPVRQKVFPSHRAHLYCFLCPRNGFKGLGNGTAVPLRGGFSYPL